MSERQRAYRSSLTSELARLEQVSPEVRATREHCDQVVCQILGDSAVTLTRHPPTRQLIAKILIAVRRIEEQTGIRPTRVIVAEQDAEGTFFMNAKDRPVLIGGLRVWSSPIPEPGAIMLDVKRSTING